MSKLVCLSLTLAMWGCAPDAGSNAPSDPAEAERGAGPVQLQMYQTCGDPVCSGWTDQGLRRCKKSEGDPCKHLDHECDPHDACNATLICSDSDPIGPYGCPI